MMRIITDDDHQEDNHDEDTTDEANLINNS